MTKLTDAQVAKATGLFVAERPALAVRLFTISQAEADILGVSVEELRRVETFAAMDKYARERGEDPIKLLFTLAAENHEEFEKMWGEHQEEIEKILGPK